MKRAFIKDLAYYLPETVLDNEELACLYPEWTAQKILDKTGIATRHIAKEDETSLDMAERAVQNLLDTSGLRSGDIDYLILITETPDYLLPASACILHGRLGLSETCGAFDINLGCSGYVYGLVMSKALIESGIAQNVLLVTSDTYSKLIHPMDKSTRTLFGDAASATWLSNNGSIAIANTNVGSRGSGFNCLIVPAGMFKEPSSDETAVVKTDENGYSRSRNNIYMNGADIMSFSIDVVPKAVHSVLEASNLVVDDIDRFYFHQANAFMLEHLKRKLKIPNDRFEMSFSDIGNTVSSSVPIALKRSMERMVFPRNGYALVCGFGVGLSWATAVLEIGE